MKNMNKYDRMIEMNRERSDEKISAAKRAIRKLLDQGERVSVPQLVKMTGASRGFFYKNPIVRAEIDRAMEQQAGTINPRRGILDKAMEGRIDLLQEEIFRLRQENQALHAENQRLQKIISKKSRSEFRNL